MACSFVLHTGGKAAFVFRPERMWTLLEALARVRLVPKRLRLVHQTAQAVPSAVLVECRKGAAARKAFRSNRRCLSKARNITKYTKK